MSQFPPLFAGRCLWSHWCAKEDSSAGRSGLNTCHSARALRFSVPVALFRFRPFQIITAIDLARGADLMGELRGLFPVRRSDVSQRAHVANGAQPAITGWLEDPAIVEVMHNPDGRLWIDRFAGGSADTGERLSAADVTTKISNLSKSASSGFFRLTRILKR
jgi:hypothetical protein